MGIIRVTIWFIRVVNLSKAADLMVHFGVKGLRVSGLRLGV